MANADDYSEVNGGPHAEIAAGVDKGTGSARDGASTKRLTLTPLSVDQVPIHPELEALQQDPPAVDEFLRRVFVEADAEIEKPRKSIGKFKDEVEGGDGGKFPVEVAKWKSEGGRGVGTWFGRSSEHVEGKPVGFEELRACLMKGHERNEAEYTPAIYDVKTVLEWDLSGREAAWKVEQKEGIMKEIEMRITQMHHTMPGGILDDRVFTVLLVSFVNANPSHAALAESIDVQIPIDLYSFPPPIIARSHVQRDASSKKLRYENSDPDATPEQSSKSKHGKDVVEGKYVSVERIQSVKRTTGGEGEPVTKWDMKTASDAGGNLPMAVQKLGVPGAIAKDVPLALKFVIAKKGSSG